MEIKSNNKRKKSFRGFIEIFNDFLYNKIKV